MFGEYLKGENRDEALHEALEFLSSGDVNSSIEAFTKRGAILFDEIEARAEIRSILTHTPVALSDCPAEILNPLRLAACLSALSGIPASEFIQAGEDFPYRRSPDCVCAMLALHASFLCTKRSLARAGLHAVRTLSPGFPNECAACAQTSRKSFTIATVPELPLVECTCDDYCRCILIATNPQRL